ncbi:GDP-mannose 4,6-dehydratase [soil metagenome]
MTRVLVTGITGQDGGYLADALSVEGGVEIHGAVRSFGDPDSVALAERHPGVVLHQADLGAPESIAGLVAEVEPEEIYNLAGISSVAQSWQVPVLTGEITGIAVASILDAALRLGEATGRAVRVLQASSSEIFGSPETAPQTESTPIRPSSPYGAAKAYAHHMVQVYRARGLAASSCILYNHESPRRPETFVTRKITASVARIAAGKQDGLELGALDVERDWGWAPDYVDAMVRAVRHDQPDDYIVATGESHTVAEFVGAAFAAVGITDWEHLVTTNPAFVRPTESTRMLGDASRARERLGWRPTVTFDELVARMVAEDVRLLREGA